MMITFQKMNNAETEKMALLASQIWREYSPCFISHEQIEYMLEKFQSPNAMKKQLQEGYQYYFIMFQADIAGYFALQPKENYLFLSKIYIKKEYRSKSVGKKAFEFIKKIAKDLSFLSIRLTVNKHNSNSINAYYKWGFQLKEEAQFDIGSGYIMDDYVLEYNLDN